MRNLTITLCFLSFLVLLLQTAALKRGVVFIPGLGRLDRLRIVLSNVRYLRQLLVIDDTWDCVVYVYAPRSDIDFWGHAKEIRELGTYCRIVENPGKLVAENMKAFRPESIHLNYQYVFLLLDDCRICAVPPCVELEKLITLMQHNELSLASPRVIGALSAKGQPFRDDLQRLAVPGTAGYLPLFIEMFVWMMTPLAYECLWELLQPQVNPYGWGYDFWYHGYASGRVHMEGLSSPHTVSSPDGLPHKMGIVSIMTALHDQNTTEFVRTDNESPINKWKALKAEEILFERSYNVPLAKYRAMSSKPRGGKFKSKSVKAYDSVMYLKLLEDQ